MVKRVQNTSSAARMWGWQPQEHPLALFFWFGHARSVLRKQTHAAVLHTGIPTVQGKKSSEQMHGVVQSKDIDAGVISTNIEPPKLVGAAFVILFSLFNFGYYDPPGRNCWPCQHLRPYLWASRSYPPLASRQLGAVS